MTVIGRLIASVTLGVIALWLLDVHTAWWRELLGVTLLYSSARLWHTR